MIPQRAVNLILDAEGVDQPSRWPGGASGVTIGYGYDLGYEQTFARDWQFALRSDSIDRLKQAIGLKGQSARQIAHRFTDITIPRTAALDVFVSKTLPRYEQQTIAAFPGAEKLPPLVFGALVSLVFNRGAGMKDDPARPNDHTRLEMRQIRDAVGRGDMKAIAQNLRTMKRLWVGKGLDGLLKRRDAEAQLVEEGASANA